MKRMSVITLVLVVAVSGSLQAFNNQRRGFVLGGGLGLAPTVSFKYNQGWLNVDQSRVGVGANFVIGHGFNARNMLVYEGNVAAFSDETTNDYIGQGFNGAAFYHYFGPLGRSAFIAGGLGFYVFESDIFDNNPGFGLMFGGGYEFSKHWQVGGYFSFGKTSFYEVDFDHHHLNILVSGIAF